jgi:hypothetical protein
MKERRKNEGKRAWKKERSRKIMRERVSMGERMREKETEKTKAKRKKRKRYYTSGFLFTVCDAGTDVSFLLGGIDEVVDSSSSILQ